MFIDTVKRARHTPSAVGNLPDKPEVIGKRLSALRRAAGFEDQKAFAGRCGISPQAWNNWERGRTKPSLPEAGKLRTIGVGTEFIYYGDMRQVPHDLATKIIAILTAEGSLDAIRA